MVIVVSYEMISRRLDLGIGPRNLRIMEIMDWNIALLGEMITIVEYGEMTTCMWQPS